ncbi:MAG: AMIN domain-containing protein [Nodosilinea sp.]
MTYLTAPSLHQPAWLQPGIWVALAGSSAMVSCLTWIAPALSAEVLSAWQFDPIAQQLTLTLPKQITPTYQISADGRAILLDLPQIRLGEVPTQAQYEGPIRQVRLTQIDDNRVQVRLELAKTSAIGADQIQLLAVVAGDQARWTLTATSGQSTPKSDRGMVVSLPNLPADPNLKWPYEGVGRLSIAAANLMLPGNLDSFNQLPQTLALDPLHLEQPESSQVSVPSLEELDRAVGVALMPSDQNRPSGNPGLSLREPNSTADPGQVGAVTPVRSIDRDNNGATIALNPASESPTVLVPDSRPQAVAATPALPALAPITQEPVLPTPTVQPPKVQAPIAQEPPRPHQSPSRSAPGAQVTPVPITFGTPLPNPGSVPSPENRDRPMPPDVLIAAGTVLELRYPGPTPLTLSRDLPRNEVLTLAKEIRDPVTNGVIAPAGSQLIGQFETQPDNTQQWVSRMLIVPGGERVPFTSNSGYLVGTPQVSGNNLAMGAGVGALAVTVLGGLSGMGLLGGALLGATTSLGTSPQTLVIQPDQVIYAQVMEDIPRSLPIALSPPDVRPWGTQPNW